MKETYRALIFDQRARAAELTLLNASLPTFPELDRQREQMGVEVREAEQDVVRSLERLEADDPAAVVFHLQEADSSLWKAERRYAAIARYSEEDRLLTLATHKLCVEMAWPGELPIVCCTADSGFATWGDADLIFVGPLEHRRLLAWPDICHEMGHALVSSQRLDLDPFETGTLHAYFEDVRKRPAKQTDPSDPDSVVDFAELANWASSAWLDWSVEFACDAVGTYLSGPSYGLQHLRLSVVANSALRYPELPDLAYHPPDLARARLIAAVLRRTGYDSAATALEQDFEALASVEPDPPYTEELERFATVFDAALLGDLADLVVSTCASLDIVAFREADVRDSLVHLLDEAWQGAVNDPAAFAEHERGLILRLRAML